MGIVQIDLMGGRQGEDLRHNGTTVSRDSAEGTKGISSAVNTCIRHFEVEL